MRQRKNTWFLLHPEKGNKDAGRYKGYLVYIQALWAGDLLEEDECRENFESLLAAIKKQYEEIINGLGPQQPGWWVPDDPWELQQEDWKETMPHQGGHLNGIIMAAYLWVTDLSMPQSHPVCLTPPAAILAWRRQTVINPKRLAKTERAVIPGFYSFHTRRKRSKTFSRGFPTLRDPLSPKPCMPTCTRTGRMCQVLDPWIKDRKKAQIHIDVIHTEEIRNLSYMGTDGVYEMPSSRSARRNWLISPIQFAGGTKEPWS